ncbi:MAG: acetoacetate--CoA ligase, partial [Cyclobacteriaceae bacterium]|nr:acetoacetate--CoA ligase [Cyclobacteriaceae bacterium]
MTPDNSSIPLWEPDQAFKEASNLARYRQWLSEREGLPFPQYQDLWKWSTDHVEKFWESMLDYFNVLYEGTYEQVLTDDPMPRTRWFEGISLSYAEHIFRNESTEVPAIIWGAEENDPKELSWEELHQKTASLASFLKASGIVMGDRVVGYLPNRPEAIISFLATNSVGATWSCTSPDFGINAIIDRFAQIAPKVLIACCGYHYNGQYYSKREVVRSLITRLPTLEVIIMVSENGESCLEATGEKGVSWNQVIGKKSASLEFTRVPFSHPIWILYSSGTTGLPKPITHGHGGILLEHLKYLAFHNDIKKGDRCFWYTTTGWMMWNYIQASLLLGGTVVLYDGSPSYPDLHVLWQYAEKAKISHFGISAGYITANVKAGTKPGSTYDLHHMRSIGSTGSPLPPEGFDWIYQEVKKDVWVSSISGGTDVCSAFVGGNPLLPVYRGEIQCRALGCALDAYDQSGRSLTGEVGEMVITRPMPSMPVFFWNDPDYSRYEESYFEMYPGVWRHGDWTKITSHDGIIIYGRSDSTLNRGGVRVGTSEIYRALDGIPEISDSLIICLETEKGGFFMPLFVMMRKGTTLDDSFISRVKKHIREQCSPRHIPDTLIQVDDIPYTISGKKVETP